MEDGAAPLFDRICIEIEQRIADGRLKEGEKLTVAALSPDFAVCRTPFDEAIQALNAGGTDRTESPIAACAKTLGSAPTAGLTEDVRTGIAGL